MICERFSYTFLRPYMQNGNSCGKFDEIAARSWLGGSRGLGTAKLNRPGEDTLTPTWPPDTAFGLQGHTQTGRHPTHTSNFVDFNEPLPPALPPRIARVSRIKLELFYRVLSRTLVREHFALGASREDAEFTGGFASVAFVAISFVSEFILWNPVALLLQVCPSNGGTIHWTVYIVLACPCLA